MTMNVTHTPGPQRVEFNHDRKPMGISAPAIMNHDLDFLCNLPYSSPKWSDRQKELLGNARLWSAAFTSYDKHCGDNAVGCAEDDLLGELLEVCRRLETSLKPYRGEDCSSERMYLCGRVEIRDIRDVLAKASTKKDQPAPASELPA